MADWMLVVLVALAILFLVDRILLWAEARGWIYWRKRRGSPASAGVLGELVQVFQPSQQFVQEEKSRLEAGVEQERAEGDVDLERGRARVDLGDEGLGVPGEKSSE